MDQKILWGRTVSNLCPRTPSPEQTPPVLTCVLGPECILKNKGWHEAVAKACWFCFSVNFMSPVYTFLCPLPWARRGQALGRFTAISYFCFPKPKPTGNKSI